MFGSSRPFKGGFGCSSSSSFGSEKSSRVEHWDPSVGNEDITPEQWVAIAICTPSNPLRIIADVKDKTPAFILEVIQEWGKAVALTGSNGRHLVEKSVAQEVFGCLYEARYKASNASKFDYRPMSPIHPRDVPGYDGFDGADMSWLHQQGTIPESWGLSDNECDL